MSKVWMCVVAVVLLMAESDGFDRTAEYRSTHHRDVDASAVSASLMQASSTGSHAEAAQDSDDERGAELYRTRIHKLLVNHCFECHSDEMGKRENGLALDSREGMVDGGDRGAAIEPGEPEESLLITALMYEEDDLQMPPRRKMSNRDIEFFREWIRLGAPVVEID